MSLEILNNPIFTTVQDLGRKGFMSFGVSNSGASDEYLYLVGNKLLQNDNNCSALEIAMGSFKAKFHKNTKIVIAGIDAKVFINDIEYELNKTIKINANDTLEIKNIKMGRKVYLCIKNGFNTEQILGSSSSSLKEHLGVFDGRKLQKGDSLDYSFYKDNFNMKYKEDFTRDIEEELTLRVIFCNQGDTFSDEAREIFLNQEFTITSDFNTMACRLDCENPIKSEINGIISEGIAFGSIQVPPNGKPIILLKNRQTIGGYPKIGSVLGVDCFKLAQYAPNQKVRFKQIDLKEAQRITKEFYKPFC